MKFGTSIGCQEGKKGQWWELSPSYSNCTTCHTTKGLSWSNWPICIHLCETFSWLLILIEETTPLWTVPFPERWSQLYMKQNKQKATWARHVKEASKQHFPMNSASLPVSMFLLELLPLAPLVMGQINPFFPHVDWVSCLSS